MSAYTVHSSDPMCMGGYCFPLSCAAHQTPVLKPGRCCKECDPPLDASYRRSGLTGGTGESVYP